MTIRAQDQQAAQAVEHEAAHAPEQQVRLIAGPGTGKSSTIEERVCWLLEQNVDPTRIAVISFTNASVVDLRLRLHGYCHNAISQESTKCRFRLFIHSRCGWWTIADISWIGVNGRPVLRLTARRLRGHSPFDQVIRRERLAELSIWRPVVRLIYI